jgi:hypothetical protein
MLSSPNTVASHRVAVERFESGRRTPAGHAQHQPRRNYPPGRASYIEHAAMAREMERL